MECRGCNGINLEKTIDLGLIPVAHRLTKKSSASLEHPMVVHTCLDCGLLQIVNPIVPEKLYLDYNFCFSNWKPQPQVIDEVRLIKDFIPLDCTILEIGSNDGTFLNELKNAGYNKLIGVEPNPIVNKISRKTNADIYTSFFDKKCAEEISTKHQKISLILSRQVIEHICDLKGFMESIKHILSKDGYILFEFPDFEIPLKYGDCSSLWEEHVNYFTENTMVNFLSRHGFKVEQIKRYEFSAGALLVLAKRTTQSLLPISEAPIHDTIELSRNYANKIGFFREKIVRILENNKEIGKLNFLFGAGCRANMFIHALKLKNYFDYVLDNQKEKQNFYLPGTNLEIISPEILNTVGSKTTVGKKTGDCFLSVNFENEKFVKNKYKKFILHGGKFYSVNCPSPLFIA